MDKTDILSLDRQEIAEYIRQAGMPSYRAGQIFNWLHVKNVSSFDEMTNLPKGDRKMLGDAFLLYRAKTENRQVSAIDGTVKYLFLMHDGVMIESVRMLYEHGATLCVSSQAGCRMGCRFCASGLYGLERNLTAGEMLSQVYAANADGPERIRGVVLMGCGEPLDNYDNVVKFIRLLSDPEGFNMSRRNITLSTCGIVPGIKRLADEDLGVTLAVSLHAPNDELRRTMMPVAKVYSIDQILDACSYYFEKTKRRVTFEYSLVKGKNDTPACAQELAGRIRGMNAHVNLIPVNPVTERGYASTTRAEAARFKKILENCGINATIRREMGRDIDGACGQLRKKHLE